MQKKMAKIASVFILMVFLMISISNISNVLQSKVSDKRYAAFFAEENQIDVFFLGSSHVRNSMFPMELWNDYGITSYNLAGEGNTIPVAYWVLVNALDYQMPKVVVMDVYDVWPGRKISPTWSQTHMAFDAFPLSVHKYQAVMDLIDDENMTDRNGDFVYDKRWDLLFDLAEYHTRWSELVEEDFYSQTVLEDHSAVWKGACPLMAIAPREEHVYAESGSVLYDETAKDYLMRMIQLCADENIELLLINTGYDCNDEAKCFADSVNEIARKQEVPYIDFTKSDIINFESDLSSSGHNTHVNFSGAEKFTTFIGQVLSEQYSLSDHRSDESYRLWRSKYRSFVNSKVDYLCDQRSLDLYLMFLADDDYDIIVDILDMSILEEQNVKCMLENLGVDVGKLGDNGNLLTIDRMNRDVTYLHNYDESESAWETVLSEIGLRDDADKWQEDANSYKNDSNDREMYVVSENETAKIRIAVVSKDSGKLIDVHMF